MFAGGREALWEEKLGLAPKFAGNAATQWGTGREAEALLRLAICAGLQHVDIAYRATMVNPTGAGRSARLLYCHSYSALAVTTNHAAS